MGEFERRQLGGLRFLQGLHEAELERFFQIFVAADGAALAERLPETVREANLQCVVPIPALELDTEDLLADLDGKREGAARGRAQRGFWRAGSGPSEIVRRASATARPHP